MAALLQHSKPCPIPLKEVDAQILSHVGGCLDILCFLAVFAESLGCPGCGSAFHGSQLLSLLPVMFCLEGFPPLTHKHVEMPIPQLLRFHQMSITLDSELASGDFCFIFASSNWRQLLLFCVTCL